MASSSSTCQRKLLKITIKRTREFPDGNQIVENSTKEALVTITTNKCLHTGTINIERITDYPDGTQSSATTFSTHDSHPEEVTTTKTTKLHDGSLLKVITTEKEFFTVPQMCSVKHKEDANIGSKNHSVSNSSEKLFKGRSDVVKIDEKSQSLTKDSPTRSVTHSHDEKRITQSVPLFKDDIDDVDDNDDDIIENSDDDYIYEDVNEESDCNIQEGDANGKKRESKEDEGKNISHEDSKDKSDVQSNYICEDTNIEDENVDYDSFVYSNESGDENYTIDEDFIESEEDDDDESYDGGGRRVGSAGQRREGFRVRSEKNRQLWDMRYKELLAYKKKHGHIDVDNRKKYASLRCWLRTQRGRRNQLSQEEFDSLLKLGFEFQVRDSIWERRFQDLEAYHKEYGHCDVPRGFTGYSCLGSWVDRQRAAHKRGKMSKDHEERLLKLGFKFQIRQILWDRSFQELVAFKKKHGHCSVPRGFQDNPKLAQWVHVQRTLNRRNVILPHNKERLLKLGFKFRARPLPWDNKYGQLLDFFHEHGHCNVPRYSKIKSSLRYLNYWLCDEKKNMKENKLSPSEVEQFLALGIDEHWDDQYEKLAQFAQNHGHLDVPNTHEDKSFADWVKRQREHEDKGILPPDRRRRLQELGFDFDGDDDVWEKRYQELVGFKEEHGHCFVPVDSGLNSGLGGWVKRQRCLIRDQKILAERKKKLARLETNVTI